MTAALGSARETNSTLIMDLQVSLKLEGEEMGWEGKRDQEEREKEERPRGERREA